MTPTYKVKALKLIAQIWAKRVVIPGWNKEKLIEAAVQRKLYKNKTAARKDSNEVLAQKLGIDTAKSTDTKKTKRQAGVQKLKEIAKTRSQKTSSDNRLERLAQKLGTDHVLKSGIAEAKPENIDVDPKRFQYKILGEQTKSGEVGSLSGVQKWDSNLAGIVQVWEDPKDQKVYVVNGHNRLALAKRLGAENLTVRVIDAKSAEEARSIGALTNIAEGRGNSLDAAKFFRDSGISREELEVKGIPMREKIAQDGLALSRLSDPLFNRVIQGEIPESRAVVIGNKIKNHDQQQELVKLIEKEEKKRRKKITNDTIEELADMVTSSPTIKDEQGGLFDLLGFTETTRSLAVEKAQVQSAIKRQLSREKRLFSTVGKTKAAKDLEKAGNQIDVEKSSEIADVAEKALNAFDQEKLLAGKVSTFINDAAARIADDPKLLDKILKEVYEEVLDELQKTYKIGKRKSNG